MKAFQSFRLDTTNQCLWRSNERVALPPKAFDVLRYLVDHPGRLITQDEMLEAVWPETYVNPELIKKYILTLRKVLGDSHETPTFIETIPKRGYQFVAAVSSQQDVAIVDSEESAERIVGRQTELDRLGDSLDKALSGQRQIVFVTGEGGIGKTTLVDTFCRRIAKHGNLRIARGQCVEGFGGKEAYYPMLEALGQLTREADNDVVVKILTQRAPTWLIQMPSLIKAEHKEALQKEILGATRERMVREICEALEVMSADTSLVLIFEDLHWVDASTLDLISALARRRESAKLLLIGTYRPVDVLLAQSPLKILKQDLQIHRLCEEVAPEYLQPRDISKYLEVEFGTLPAGLADLIHQHSGGNPLFMTAIVGELIKSELIAQNGGSWFLTRPLEDIVPGVPDTLQQMLEIQFERLSTAEQRVLKSASVAGDRFSAWSISETLSLEASDVESLCDGLAGRQQFIKSAGLQQLSSEVASSTYEFRHSLYRNAIYRRMSDVVRSTLHRRIGERIESLCTSDLEGCDCTQIQDLYSQGQQEFASELAVHFEEGRAYDRAIEYLLLTAQNAGRRFAYHDSIPILHHALELLPRVASNSRAQTEIRILGRLGEAHFALGEMENSARTYQLQSDRAAAADLKAAQVRSLMSLAMSAGFIDPDKGITVCDKAAEVSATQDDLVLQARAKLLAASTRLLFQGWRKEDADACAAAAQIIREKCISAPSTFEEVLYANVLPFQGGSAEALRWAAPDLSDATEIPSTILYPALAARSLALMHLGRPGETLHIAREAQGMADRNGNHPWYAIFRCLEARTRTALLDFEGARQICEVTMRSEGERLGRQPKTISQLFFGYAELALGRYGEALLHFRQILDQPRHPLYFLQWYWRMLAQLGLVHATLASGDIATARREADTFLTAVSATANPETQTLGWETKAQVAIAEEDFETAVDCVKHGEGITEKFNIPNQAWRLHATAFKLFTQAGKKEEAEVHRSRAETVIWSLANSLPENEPLRVTFLAADPVREILVNAA